MLIVTDKPERIKEINFIDQRFITKSHYASFEDIRWHRLRLINHELIVLLPQNLDISYHLNYLQLTSDSSIIIIADNHDNISKKHHNNILCLEPNISKDFFSGCLMTIQKSRQKTETSAINFIKTMNVGKFVLTNIQQVAVLSRAIAEYSPKTPQLRRGVFELLLNAFEHGVYQLGFDLKRELISEKKYFAELNRRIRHPDFKDKQVELVLQRKEDGTYININDPGLGFDYKPYLTFNKNLSDSQTGRGISYAANYCFDQLLYKDDGKSVFAVLKNESSNKPLN